MPVLYFEDNAILSLNTLNAIALIPISPNPLVAKDLTKLLAEKMVTADTDRTIIIFPQLYAGAGKIRPYTMRAFLQDYLKGVQALGVNKAILVTDYLLPKQFVVLEEVAEKMCWRRRMKVVSVSSYFASAQQGKMNKDLTKNMDEVLPLLENYFEEKKVKNIFRSKFYFMPFHRTDFKLLFFVFVYIILFSGLWLLFLRFLNQNIKVT